MKKLNVIVVACLMALSYVSANAQNEQPQTQVDAFCGQIVEITATPASGYRFVRWSDEDPAAPSAGATRVVTINATNNNYVAIFEQVTFQVNVASENTQFGTVTISRL